MTRPPFGGLKSFRPPLAKALQLLYAAHKAQEQFIALAQDGQALAGKGQQIGIRCEEANP